MMSEPQAISIEDYEGLNPHAVVSYQDHKLIYCTPNIATLWRVQTLTEKEPVTIEWIAGFDEGAVLVDVGANVGMYTMLAAVTRAAMVYAFEPESQNYALLNKNIVMNKVFDRVRAWPVALSDATSFGEIHLAEFKVGSSCHAYGEALNFKLEPQRFPYLQGAVSATLDQLVSDGVVPMPDHIKIDVDGFEHKVIAGAREVLGGSRLRSLLIEVNSALEPHQQLIAELVRFGFHFDPAQVARAERKDGPFKGVAEYLFRR